MDDIRIEQTSSGSAMLLGCYVESNLKWNKQVDFLLSKLASRLGSICHLQNSCPFKIRKTLIEGVFNSVILYCLPLFGGIGKVLVNKIQILQNRAARIACGAPSHSSRDGLYKRLNWLTINQLISYHTLISIFKIRETKEPEYLADFLCRTSRNN